MGLGLLSVTQHSAFPSLQWGKAPPSPLSYPSSKCLSSSIYPPPPCRHSRWERPWDGKGRFMPPHWDSNELSPGCQGLYMMASVRGEGGVQTTLCPTGTHLPCHRLPRGALKPLPCSSLPWCCYWTPSQLSALATLNPPAGPPSPGPHYPSPSPCHPVAT
ncbi:hypothetical protein mRhiFer1_008099 [Rhinolophus ferrumequinum]|uniref:Uncharacterized protein n=1 Tax=Rhinolophus ferrumequinum TaxID=59479 RepID=A0A7J7W7F0_RHIFE|nr:hypothetical protein mRhiFer1_008099 [Rhinolophus ferrumequinum]